MRSFILVPRPRGRLCPQRSLPIRSGHSPLLISNALRRGAGVYLPAHARAAYTSRPPRTLTPIFPPLLSPPFFSFPPLSLLPPLSHHQLVWGLFILSRGASHATGTNGTPAPQGRSRRCIHIHPHGAPLLMGRPPSPRGGGRTSEEKEKGMTQGVLSFHGALLSMIEPFFFTFRPSSFTFVQLEVSESVSDVM